MALKGIFVEIVGIEYKYRIIIIFLETKQQQKIFLTLAAHLVTV